MPSAHPQPGDRFHVAGRSDLLTVASVQLHVTEEGDGVLPVRHTWLVTSEHGSRWTLRPNAFDDGVRWVGTHLPADPAAPRMERRVSINASGDEMAPTAKNAIVRFRQYSVRDGLIGGTDQYLRGELALSIVADGQEYPTVTASVKLSGGDDYFSSAVLEIGSLSGFPLRLDYDRFRREAEAYCKDLLGTEGTALGIGRGVHDVAVRDTLLSMGKTVLVPLAVPGSDGW